MGRKICEGEVRKKLAEVEGRDRARKAMLIKVGETVSDASDTIGKGNEKGTDEPVHAKQEREGETPLRAR